MLSCTAAETPVHREMTEPSIAQEAGRNPGDLPELLLEWYDRHRRILPWRTPPGGCPDAYCVWLSEIMLQQTTVTTVKPYFEAFLRRWPTVHDLAAAALDDVLHAWQGLGYYARARNLHKCAVTVSRDMGGRYPDTEAALRELPGIGPYTAAAVAAIAFDRPATVLDGNVERVMARLHGVSEPLPGVKPRLRILAAQLTPRRRPGDYAQAIMDLGATVCTPKRPACTTCPWSEPCLARESGRPELLPKRSPRPVRPVRRGVAFWVMRSDGAVLLRRRAERGLLGGMMEVPSTAWRARSWSEAEARKAAPVAAEWRVLPGVVRHGFTHFELKLKIWAGRIDTSDGVEGVWCPVDRFGDYALPTLMKKVVAHASEFQARAWD